MRTCLILYSSSPPLLFNKQQKQVTKQKRATEVEDAPMYKVLVIGDEEYNREHVVLSIQDIVPDTDNTRVRQAACASTAGRTVVVVVCWTAYLCILEEIKFI